MTFKKPSVPYTPFGVMAKGQVCKHCKLSFEGNHKATELQAVVCLHAPSNDCRPRWDQHGLVTVDGRPYLSAMESIGQLAGMLEERGYEAYSATMDGFRDLVARLSQRPPELVKPVEAWFEPDPPKEPGRPRHPKQ